jgi:predicted ribosome quality control (RQC) complex YloA/Tae2 family protein
MYYCRTEKHFFVNLKTGELDMKTFPTAVLVLNLLLSGLIFTAGCQQQASDCTSENKLLRQTIEEQKKKMEEQEAEIERLEQVEQNYALVVIKIVSEMDNAKEELAEAKKEIKKLKKTALRQKENQQVEDDNTSNTPP